MKPLIDNQNIGNATHRLSPTQHAFRPVDHATLSRRPFDPPCQSLVTTKSFGMLKLVFFPLYGFKTNSETLRAESAQIMKRLFEEISRNDEERKEERMEMSHADKQKCVGNAFLYKKGSI